MPDEGRISIRARMPGSFFLRPPSWAPREQVRAFVDASPVPVNWSGSYIRFEAQPGDELSITYPLVAFTHRVSGLWKSCAPDLEMTFSWLGNMVVDVLPQPEKTPLFTGKPRNLPECKTYS
jgi:hypothetical protein